MNRRSITGFAGPSFILLATAAGAASAQVPVSSAIADYSLSPTVSGSWRYTPTATGSEARFIDSAARAQIVISCTRSTRGIALAKPASGASPFLQVWTTSLSRNLPASFNPTSRQLTATVTFNDTILDAMIMSRGRIAIGVAGQPALVLPPWGEIGRVVEDCRL